MVSVQARLGARCPFALHPHSNPSSTSAGSCSALLLSLSNPSKSSTIRKHPLGFLPLQVTLRHAAHGYSRGDALRTFAGKRQPGPAERGQRKEGGEAPRRSAQKRVDELLEEAESQELTEAEFNAMLDELDEELEEDLKAGRIKEINGVLVEVDPETGAASSEGGDASIEDEEIWKQKVIADIKSWADDLEYGDFEEDFEFDEFEEDEFEEDDFDEFEEEGVSGGLEEEKLEAAEVDQGKNLISAELGGSEPEPEVSKEGEAQPEEKGETPEEAEERAAMAMALGEITTWQERKLRWALEKSEHRRHKLQIKNIVSDTKLPRKVVLAWLKVNIKEPRRPLEPAVLRKGEEEGEEGAAAAASEEEDRWGPSRKRIKKVNLETFEKVYRIAPQPSREQLLDLVKLTHIPYKRVVEWFDERNGVTPLTNAEVRTRRKDERKKKKKHGGQEEEKVSPPPMTMIEPDSDGVSLQ